MEARLVSLYKSEKEYSVLDRQVNQLIHIVCISYLINNNLQEAREQKRFVFWYRGLQ